MSSDKPVSLVDKRQEESDDLLESLFEHIEVLDERDQPISSIALVVRFSNGDSSVTFHGDDLVGLLGAVHALTSKISKKIEETEVKIGNFDDNE